MMAGIGPLVPASNAAMYAVMGFAYPGFNESITDAYRDGLSIGGNEGLKAVAVPSASTVPIRRTKSSL